MKICSVDGCDNSSKYKGYCSKHYQKFIKYGDPLADFRAKPKICKFEGCDKKSSGYGYCKSHYGRFIRNGDPKGVKAYFGEPSKWIEDNKNFDGNECLIWPFGRRKDTGYGYYNYMGIKSPHRAMCLITHGAPPSKKHEAAHSCGNGHLGCVNPKHLRWATRTENQADRVIHGVDTRGSRNGMSKLTEENVIEIRELYSSLSCAELAEKFSVSKVSILNVIKNRTWAWLDALKKTESKN